MRHDHPIPNRAEFLDLASNDYFQLSTHPAVTAAAQDALHTWGIGARSSRVVTGTTPVHHELESTLAHYFHAPSALVFSSGYTANLAAVTTFSAADTLLVCDYRNHASLIDACRLSSAAKIVCDVTNEAEVARMLRDRTVPDALVICDAVDSVTGETLDVTRIHSLAAAHGARLLIDNAHGLGVWGDDGAGPFPALFASAQPPILTCTLSKALGAQGGAIICSAQQRQHLVDTARTFIFDTALSPVVAAAATTALGVLCEKTHIIRKLHELTDTGLALLDAAGLPVSRGSRSSDTPILYLPIGDPENARKAAQYCCENKILVGCFTPPSVAHTNSGLRLTLHPNITHADLRKVIQVLTEAFALG